MCRSRCCRSRPRGSVGSTRRPPRRLVGGAGPPAREGGGAPRTRRDGGPAEAVGPRHGGGTGPGAALSRVAEALLAAEPALTAADSVVGDGDLGISLARGARAILEALPTLPLDDPSATARSLGVALEHSLGGTSGPLYAAFLARASAALARDSNDWVSALRDGCSAVWDLGGAHPGDRTMLDDIGAGLRRPLRRARRRFPGAEAPPGGRGRSGRRGRPRT